MSVNGKTRFESKDMRDWVNQLNLNPVCPTKADGTSTGIYPDCVCESGKVYLASYNVCAKQVACDAVPDDVTGSGKLTGTWPECSGCKNGTFDVESGTCK